VVTLGVRTAASAALDSVTPRRVSRWANIRAVVSRPDSVPTATSSWRVGSHSLAYAAG
jgi:hypothetical protein